VAAVQRRSLTPSTRTTTTILKINSERCRNQGDNIGATRTPITLINGTHFVSLENDVLIPPQVHTQTPMLKKCRLNCKCHKP
jgi:hypothetical protein